jgi:hypothetical protein
MVLKMFLQQVTDRQMSIHDLNWKLIDKHVADNLHLNHDYVKQLRKNRFEDVDIMISGCSANVESPHKKDELDDDDDDDYEEEGGSTKQDFHMLNSND